MERKKESLSEYVNVHRLLKLADAKPKPKPLYFGTRWVGISSTLVKFSFVQPPLGCRHLKLSSKYLDPPHQLFPFSVLFFFGSSFSFLMLMHSKGQMLKAVRLQTKPIGKYTGTCPPSIIAQKINNVKLFSRTRNSHIHLKKKCSDALETNPNLID
jgi:hypothetical protein